MTESEKERAAVVAFARRTAQVHHRIAAEHEGVRAQHIALSSAYISVAVAIESGEHLKEGR